MPVYGVDLTDENLAQEAGRTASAISFTKGCYLGQEPIARIDAMGHVNRELRSLRIAGEAIPSAGARVFSDAAASAAVGTITSAAILVRQSIPRWRWLCSLERVSARQPGVRGGGPLADPGNCLSGLPATEREDVNPTSKRFDPGCGFAAPSPRLLPFTPDAVHPLELSRVNGMGVQGIAVTGAWGR